MIPISQYPGMEPAGMILNDITDIRLSLVQCPRKMWDPRKSKKCP